ncbi:MAG: YhjD/YihY/BrkB family envelope integrity protein [Thermoanaerobaculia bacterium]
MTGQEEKKEEEPAHRPLSERVQRARKWFWDSWTEEAILVHRRAAQGKVKAQIRMVELFLFIRELWREFWKAEISNRAASLAYTTLLSLIPLLVAFSTRLGEWFKTALPEFRSRLDQFLNLVIPYDSTQFAHHINRFLENAGAASGVGGVVFLFISFRLFMAVEGSVNQIWKVETLRGYRPRIRAFTMILFWGPVLIGLSFTSIAAVERGSLLSSIIYNKALSTVFPLMVIFLAFTMLFWLVPATRVKLSSAAIGALVAALLFELVRFGFAYYVRTLFEGRLNVIYGAFGLFILFLLSLELMWIVILLGVAVSYVYQNLQGILRASEQQLEDRQAYDLFYAFRALIEITRRFEQREEPLSSYRLAELFKSTDVQMARVLKKLEEARLVRSISGEWTGYVPGCDPDRISVEEVVLHMEGGGREVPPGDPGDGPRESVIGVFQTVRNCTHEALGRRSIGQIVRDLYGDRRPSRAADLSPAR